MHKILGITQYCNDGDAQLAGQATELAELAEAHLIAGREVGLEAGQQILDQQGALQLVASTPFGEMPVDSFIGTIWVDALTHAWDIADAAGIDHGIDPATADAAYETLAPISELLRGPGRFDDPIDVAEDAVARFIGFAGRTSVRA